MKTGGMAPTVAVSKFLCDPLTKWFLSCLEDSSTPKGYYDIIDGSLIHKVFLQFHPEPAYGDIIDSESDPTVRVKNLRTIIENLKCFYRNELGHVLLLVPSAYNLGRYPERYVDEAKLLLLLLLGSAAQSSKEEDFINSIKKLECDTQRTIVNYIKQFINNQKFTISKEMIESDSGGTLTLIENLIKERNSYDELWDNIFTADINERIDSGCEDSDKSSFSLNYGINCDIANATSECNSYIRKQREELLQKKYEVLYDSHNDLKQYKSSIDELRNNSVFKGIEAWTAKVHKDDLDLAIKPTKCADRLEIDVHAYQEILDDLKMYKEQATELCQENCSLLNTNKLLAKQLKSAKKCTINVIKVVNEISKHKDTVDGNIMERNGALEVLHYFCNEKSQLRKISPDLNGMGVWILDNDDEEALQINSILEQLRSILELHSERPEEHLKKVCKLEEENKNLSTQIKSLNKTKKLLDQKNEMLETTYSRAIGTIKKLQNSLQDKRNNFESLQSAIEMQLFKCEIGNNLFFAKEANKKLNVLFDKERNKRENLNLLLDESMKKLEKFEHVQVARNVLQDQSFTAKTSTSFLRISLQSQKLSEKVTELLKQRDDQDERFTQLLDDHKCLQESHKRLSIFNKDLKRERDILQADLWEAKNESRGMREMF